MAASRVYLRGVHRNVARGVACGGAVFAVAMMLALAPAASAEQRFPPPEFESNYKMPVPTTPAARSLLLQYLDVGVLLAALAVATWLVHRKRSRKGLVALAVFSLGYFGFYRNGCICAIGSVQNLALASFDRSYALPVTALVFLLAPIALALFSGRAFCAAVCPHGAIQELVLIKPLKVPAWLEHGLGLVPFVLLGAGVALAATGSAFVFCRYDPFVPLFRLSGSLNMIALGAAFLVVGMFVGRPFCRFLCPYGALLRMASQVAKWPVRLTFNDCKRCRMCESSCPYGALREPDIQVARLEAPEVGRRRRVWLVALLPVLVVAGAFAGSKLGRPASHLHPTVALAESHARQQRVPVNYQPMTPEALALERASADPEGLLTSAVQLREHLVLAGWIFGGWVGLVIGCKLLALSLRTTRNDYEPDRSACVACARCYEDCPNEKRRRASGLPAPAGTALPHPASVEGRVG